MKVKPSKYYFNNKCILLIILSIYIFNINAQNNSFIVKLKDAWVAWDIKEDSKGGFIASIGSYCYRYSSSGDLLWKIKTGGNIDLFTAKDKNKFFTFGGGESTVGSFDLGVYNLNGKILSYNYRNPINETQTIWDFVFDSAKSQFVVCGWRYFIKSDHKKNYWIAGVDLNGKILWEQNLTDLNHSRYFRRIFKNNKTGGYFLLGNDEKVYGRHELFNVDSAGRFVNRAPIEPQPVSEINAEANYGFGELFPYKNNQFVASMSVYGSKIPETKWGAYWYIYNFDGTLLERMKYAPENTDGAGEISKIKNNKYAGLSYNAITGKNELVKLDSNLTEIYRHNLYSNNGPNEAVYIKKIYPSRDGGYYGIAEGDIAPNGWSNPTEHWVYIFKTDSLGNIKPTPEYSEKLQPCMLQPNPAMGKVRIAIPYYYGTIQAQFYTLQGQMMLEQTKNEADNFDIRSLSAGIYVVHAKITETGEVRKMKLVVQ